jgi:hypothetical protein
MRYIGHGVLSTLLFMIITYPALASQPFHLAVYGETRQSSLQGSVGEVWRFWGTGGDCANINIHSSEFRPVLRVSLGQPDGGLLRGHDEQTATSDQLSVDLPRDSYYFIHAASASGEEVTGGYTLRLTRC